MCQRRIKFLIWGGRGGDAHLLTVLPALSLLVLLHPPDRSWVRAYDPLTLIGGMNWSSYAVEIEAKLPPGAKLPSGEVQAGLSLAPCDNSSLLQQFAPNEPAIGYYQVPHTNLCLNTVGCGADTDVVLYECLVTGKGCCGNNCQSNLEWFFQDGQLRVNSSHQCLTTASDGRLRSAGCIAGNASQKYEYLPVTMQIRQTNTNQVRQLKMRETLGTRFAACRGSVQALMHLAHPLTVLVSSRRGQLCGTGRWPSVHRRLSRWECAQWHLPEGGFQRRLVADAIPDSPRWWPHPEL